MQLNLREGDEMYTLLYNRYPHWIKKFCSVVPQKPTKVVKEKEFTKFLGQEKQKKKTASYMREERKDEGAQQQLEQQSKQNLDDILKQKRDPTKINDSYQPHDVEKYWYQYWESQRYFNANNERALKNDKRYVMILPPPNVTGYLHLGHALTSAIEDTLIRTHRMRGYETLYVPGTDHAGIATQTVVEKHLYKTEKLTKHDLGRDQFLSKVWDWKDQHGNWILNQLKRVGSSLDWDRYAFTMDQPRQVAVTEAFVRLHEKGLIYRANRLVNWCCKMGTALSDIEVDYMDIEKPIEIEVPGHSQRVQFGWLTKFAYKVDGGGDEEIIVATTRLETMLGDVAVAVNSKDVRYQHLHGKNLIHPFIPNRLIKIIVDDQLVDMSFGTGAVKVTPAHDPNDYECGLRHNLQQINIFNEDGSVTNDCGQYSGMMRFDVRRKMEQDMKQLNIFRGKEANKMRLGVCSRSKDVIEPMMKPQWYINCQTIRQKMLDVVKSRELQIIPQEFESMWFQWIEGLRDWCISRQIWWGHRCPAYLATVNGIQSDSKNEQNWIIARDIDEAYAKAELKYKTSRENIQLKQDEDVLDTWFSSGLFPFSTLGWPNNTLDMKVFFPNTILETGWDILFFWVARMVQMSLWLLDTLPFKYVFLHPIIRDKDGKKMSKSLGNVIDPVEIIDGTTLDNLKAKVIQGNLPQSEIERTIKSKEAEFPDGIPECGSDALRFGLLSYMQKTSNINLDVLRIIGYRQFCNKIWQTVRFALSKLPQDLNYKAIIEYDDSYALINQWILIKLNIVVLGVNKAIDEYEFGIATQRFQNFWQYELCDVYLEAIKYIFAEKNKDENLKQQTQITLMTCLEVGLRLLHPMMPFLSEELWQKLPNYQGKKDALCIAEYPEANQNILGDDILDKFNVLQNVARSLRQICSSANLPPSARPDCFALIVDDKSIEDLIIKEQDVLTAISRTNSVQIIKAIQDDHKTCGQGTAGDRIQLFVTLKQHLNFAQEIQRIEKKLGELIKFIQNLEKKVSQYSDKVPAKVKLEDSQKMEKYQKEKQVLIEQIDNLKKNI